MESWEALWKAVFWIGLSTFGVMAVWVTIAGYFDVRRMFRTMRESHEEDDARDAESPAATSGPREGK